MGLHTLDILVLLGVGAAAVFGWLRGFVHEVLSLFAWVLVVFALKLVHAPVTQALTGIVATSTGAAVLAFALIAGAAWFGGRMVAQAIGKRTRSSILGPLDRAMGFGFGALKGLILASLAFLLVVLVTDTAGGGPKQRPDWLTKARTYPLLNATSAYVADVIGKRRTGQSIFGGDGNASDAVENETAPQPTPSPTSTKKPIKPKPRHTARYSSHRLRGAAPRTISPLERRMGARGRPDMGFGVALSDALAYIPEMNAPLYNTDILRLAASIPHHERLPNPMGSSEKRSPICGSRVIVDVNIAEGRVADVGMLVRACALGQASASLFAAHAIGRTPAELAVARDALTAWLAGEGAAPDWPDLDLFTPALAVTARHPSIRLAFEAGAEAAAQATTR